MSQVKLTKEHLDILWHALGLKEANGRMWREVFFTGTETKDGHLCRDLVDHGHLVAHKPHPICPEFTLFSVTEAGKDFARNGIVS